MWTFDNPPLKLLQETLRLRRRRRRGSITCALASVRFNDGGSGSFVSPDGLVLTNHHVARGQLQKVSTPEKNYAATGFLRPHAGRGNQVPRPRAERADVDGERHAPCAIGASSRAWASRDALSARRAEMARIEKESLDKTGLRSDVVTLYQGGEYWLYRYKKLHRHPPRVRARGAGGVLRRRSRQLHLPALRPRLRASSASTRTASRSSPRTT